MTVEMKHGWVPVRNKDKYCSPLCGGDCLYSDYNEAHKRSKSLCQKLGKGWKPEVWENTGWHWCVVSPCQRFRVHNYGPRDYGAFLCDKGEVGGRYFSRAETAKKAIAAVVKQAQADLERIGTYIIGTEVYLR